MATKPKQPVRIPGELPGDDDEEIQEGFADPAVEEADVILATGEPNDIDDVIAASQLGNTMKINKPRPIIPEAIVERPDMLRPMEAAVNMEKKMSYAEAMELLEAGKLKRSVLTERGWVCAPVRKPAEEGRRS